MFNPGLTLSQFLIYFPAFLAVLSAIPLYFIGKYLYNRKAGVLAALLYVFDISNFSRSLGGDPDSDAIIILVSMIVITLFIATYKIASSAQTFNKKVLLFSILTTLGLWIWYSTWAGYWYIFWLMTGFVVLKLMVDVFIKRDIKLVWKNSKIIIYSFLFFVILSFLMTIPSYGMNKINSALAGPIEFQSIKGEDSEFPNVYVSVAELQQSGGPKEIIQRTSAIDGAGILISPFFLMIYALILLLYSFYKTRKHYDTVILLLVWFLGPFFATIVAIRFSVLFSAPLAIGSAIFLTIILDYALNKEKTKEKIEEQITEEIV
jgi:asparagine N-glycosylation enzyme membrane subunit Stt3